jgi:hypothetical protein
VRFMLFTAAAVSDIANMVRVCDWPACCALSALTSRLCSLSLNSNRCS